MQIPDTTAPTFSVYTSRDGLSDEIWNAVGVDADGFVWAGSETQLARFDGDRWTLWPFAGAGSLVRKMLTDANGNLWALFERDGLARYADGQWQLMGGDIRVNDFSVASTPKGDQYWMSHDHGFARLDDGAWVEDPGNASLPMRRAGSLAQTERLLGGPRQWMGSRDEGLWYRELTPTPGPWTQFQPWKFSGQVQNLLRGEVDGKEVLWLLNGASLTRLTDTGARTWSGTEGEIPAPAAYNMVQTHDAAGRDTLWIASRRGLLRLRDERFELFDRRHGLPANAVRGLSAQRVDGIDVLWLATEGGVARATLTNNPWQTVSRLGAEDIGIFGVLLEPDGKGGERLWIGSARDGLHVLEDGQWRIMTHENGALPAPRVRGIWRVPHLDGGYRRLLGLHNAPLLEVHDDFSMTPLPTPWRVNKEETATRVIARHFDGALEWWISTRRSGMYRWRNGEWTGYTLGRDTQQWAVFAVTEQIDARGTSWLWAASMEGIAVLDGEQWRLLPDPLPQSSGGVVDVDVLTFGARQELWASTLRHGVLRYDITDPANPRPINDDRLPPPPSPAIYGIASDSRGHIYVCSSNGVQQLTPADNGKFNERVFRRRDGLAHDECNAGSMVVDAQDRFWVGTLGGLSVFDPSVKEAPLASEPKRIHFTSAWIDGHSQILSGTDELRVPPNARDIRVNYTLLTGMRESESRYRSQLVGEEFGSGEWNSDHSRSLSRLPPGDYVLRVEGIDYAGVASAPRDLRIRMAPQWHQRRWLQVSATVFTGVVLLLGIYVYERVQRRRRKRLERTVAQRTAELRGANERLLELSYQDPLTGVANRRSLMERLEELIPTAHAQQFPLGVMLIDVDHFKPYNDRNGHLAGDEALRAVAQALSDTVRERDLMARFGGEEFACLETVGDAVAVARVAERMRATVADLPAEKLGSGSGTLTVSIGAWSGVPGANQGADDLLTLADEALYAAKRGGRNRVVLVDGAGE